MFAQSHSIHPSTITRRNNDTRDPNFPAHLVTAIASPTTRFRHYSPINRSPLKPSHYPPEINPPTPAMQHPQRKPREDNSRETAHSRSRDVAPGDKTLPSRAPLRIRGFRSQLSRGSRLPLARPAPPAAREWSWLPRPGFAPRMLRPDR